jgi:ABC-2 type transport system ATP-binding protein
MTAAISCQGLVRRFGDISAVDGLDLEIDAGQVFGVLGHNGAGKTTTVRLLNGLLTPDDGEARLFGADPLVEGHAVRARVGVLTETPAVDPRLTGRENLEAFARLYDLGEARARARAGEALERFGLAARGDDRAGEYSKGMKQRLALARTLLHDPELLFLDEPTAGLDPVAAHELHRHVEELVSGGRTVFLCTHNLFEAQRLCDRVAVLRDGRKVLEGAPDELAARFPELARHRVQVHADDRDTAASLFAEHGWDAEVVDGEFLLRGLEREDLPRAIASLVGAGLRVYAFVPEQASLEDIYLALHDAGDA